MKIQLNRGEKIANLPDIIKIPVILNFKVQKFPLDINRSNICDFEWASSIEEKIFENEGGDIWSRLYEGEEVEIPERIEVYWNSLLNINKSELNINNIEYKNNIYKAQINDKKVTLEIKYEK